MALNNKWVGYIDRSYQQIKTSLLSRLTTSNPEISDHSEGNIFIIILDMFAGLTEMLGYYIDNMAREAFIQTARRFTSMVRLTKVLDYHIKAAYPASVDIKFSFDSPLSSNASILEGTIVADSNGVNFITTSNLNMLAGATEGTIGASQITIVTGSVLGVTTSSANQKFALPANYVDSTAEVVIASVTWTRVNSLGLSKPTSKHYVVNIDSDGIAYVIFGNGTFGLIPPTGNNVIANFHTTLATLGNVGESTITTVVSTLSLPGVTTITVNNQLAASGGIGYEDIESIRVNAPLSIRTLDRAVTRQDYIDISRLAPGVGKAEVIYNCGKSVQVYIAPSGGGIAQSPLLASTKDFLEVRKMITTFITVSAAGETPIIIALDILGKYRIPNSSVITEVTNALLVYGDFDNQTINKPVRVSDIISLVDNLSTVESVDLVTLTTRPYPRPVNHIIPLSWAREVTSLSTVKTVWKIEYAGGTSFNIYLNSAYITTVPSSTLYTSPDGSLELTVYMSSYSVGNSWQFTVYPANRNIIMDDLTVPRVDIADISLNITQQLTPSII